MQTAIDHLQRDRSERGALGERSRSLVAGYSIERAAAGIARAARLAVGAAPPLLEPAARGTV